MIATDIRSNRKIVKDGYNGLLVKSEDPHDLADAIQKLYENPGLREKLASNARESVREYDWNCILGKLEQKLEELVKPGLIR